MAEEELQKLLQLSELEGVDEDVIGKSVVYLFTEAKNLVKSNKFTDALVLLEQLLSLAWEKLNCGHWKDVPDAWRALYSHLSGLKALAILKSLKEDVADMIKALNALDKGLLMGIPICNDLLCSSAQKLQNQVTETRNKGGNDSAPETDSLEKPVSHELPTLRNPIKRLHLPALDIFRKLTESQTPVIITDAVSHWPALTNRRWTTGYIRSVAGDRLVPVELGARYTDSEWTQRIMSISEYIDKYVVSKSDVTGYLAQHQLFDQIPALRRDLSVPEYCCLGSKPDYVDVNVWFGPEATISPLHTDPKHNLLAQVRGCKYIQIYSPNDTEYLSPHDGFLLDNTSQVDVENPDLTKFPNFPKATVMDCVLRPGDLLFIPSKYWHYVRSLSPSISVSFWWE